MPPEPPPGYDHLRLEREIAITERHRPPNRRPRFVPEDPLQFGAQLARRLESARALVAEDLDGYDARRLLKIVLRDGESVDDLRGIPGIDFLSRENKTVVLAFASEEGMATFEARLSTLASTGQATRAQLLYAIEDFARWTPADRTGRALREQGFPPDERFVLDVELWPEERADRRARMLENFRAWLGEAGLDYLDQLLQPSLVMVRVRCSRLQAEELLLEHRDVRVVDLPARFGIARELLSVDLGQFPIVAPPDPDAPAVAVLDSGLTTAHPLLAPAVGDAQGFVLPERDGGDLVPGGHGSFVAGLALYGRIEECIRTGEFVPVLRLFSGKVFRDDGTDETRFVENAVDEAVEYFVREYGCKVFTLCYGDLNKIYDGRHLRGLAYTLDRLSRERGVLFVVSAGNLMMSDLPDDLRQEYPNYLFGEDARLLDPGTALNALTVGGLAFHEATHGARRYPDTLEAVPVARTDQPSPITRCGPSLGGAIKPDFVEYAGNIAIDRNGRPTTAGLSVVSLDSGFADGRQFREDIGTSFAAPVVANKAARLLSALPQASPELLRALLGAHAQWPQGCIELLDPQRNAGGRELLFKAVGYGRIDDAALYRSLDNVVTLTAEERISTDRHHFFEVPLPDSWRAGNRRERTVSVALAYTPAVRTTRLEYRATRIKFSLVVADNLDQVTTAFRANREDGLSERSTNRWISSEKRNCGTLQVSRWRFRGAIGRRRLFVVVTRQDPVWSPVRDQPEAYAVCMTLADRERAEARLHAEVRAVLQARARLRARA